MKINKSKFEYRPNSNLNNNNHDLALEDEESGKGSNIRKTINSVDLNDEEKLNIYRKEVKELKMINESDKTLIVYILPCFSHDTTSIIIIYSYN